MMKGSMSGDTYTTWRAREHVFRKYNSFGISKSILDQLKLKGINKIIIEYKSGEHKWIYLATVDLFLNSPLEYMNGKDLQKHLPLKVMTKLQIL